MPDRNATTTWQGDLLGGSGVVTLDSSNAGQFPVSFPSRAEEPNGLTSPEELIAAAHSACYSMSLAHILTRAGTPPERIDASAEVTVDRGEKGLAITGVALTVSARVPGVEEAAFAEAATTAKENCPVSRALAGTSITLDASLEE